MKLKFLFFFTLVIFVVLHPHLSLFIDLKSYTLVVKILFQVLVENQFTPIVYHLLVLLVLIVVMDTSLKVVSVPRVVHHLELEILVPVIPSLRRNTPDSGYVVHRSLQRIAKESGTPLRKSSTPTYPRPLSSIPVTKTSSDGRLLDDEFTKLNQ